MANKEKLEKTGMEQFIDAEEFVSNSESNLSTEFTSLSLSLNNPSFSQSLGGLPEPASKSETLDIGLEPPGQLTEGTSLYELCKTKVGSSKVQNKVTRSTPEELDQIVRALAPNIGDLMVDVFGNYMCQALFHTCTSHQRILLLNSMHSQLWLIAKHPIGTHSLQVLVSHSNLDLEEDIYKNSFKNHILEMSVHNHASYVIQKLLVVFKDQEFIFRELRRNICKVACRKLGICVVKKCIRDPQIKDELLERSIELMQDPYGNYAIQQIVEVWREAVEFSIFNSITGKIPQLCIQKYSSNVMETCFKLENLRHRILEELVNEGKISMLLNNPYGCYVLRTAVIEANDYQKSMLMTILINEMPNLHQKKLKPRWEEIMEHLTRSIKLF